MYFTRKAKDTLLRISKQYPVIFLTGARQVGKTTLIKDLFRDYEYVSFDLPSIAEQAETNPQLFFSQHAQNILLDEVQYVPSLFRYLKYRVDEHPQKGAYILTGSQNFLLMKNITESLAGRCGILHLFPLSFEEIKESGHYPEISELDLVVKGGYPKPWAEAETDREIFFSSYIATYIERDVRNILNIGKIREFERFLRVLAMRSAQILSYSDIARDVGVAVSTIKDWINVLWASNQIFLLEPYYRNLGKRVTKSPKIYLCDTGLLCFLLNIHKTEDLLRSPLLGNIWETFVVNQIVSAFGSRGIRPDFYFWRTRDGSEIDIVIERAGSISAFEIKFSEFIKSADAAALKNFMKTAGKEHLQNAGFISRTSHEYLLDDGIRVMNISSFLSFLRGIIPA